jgi:carboxyl-terminal processing protease
MYVHFRERKIFTLSMVVLILGVLSPAWSSGGSTSELNDAKRANLQKTLETMMAKYKIPGAIAGLWFPGIGDWVGTAGIGNPVTGEAPKPGGKVRIGSITKSFTATVVLQLVDEGKLSLDDPLSKWEPQVPGANGITVRQLLNMTSGLYNYTDISEFWDKLQKDPMAIWTPQELVDMAVAKPAVFTPGSKYMYCNTNYILLGMIIEKVTGKTAGEEITTRIIDRLGLKDTSFPMTPDIGEPYIRGNVPEVGEANGPVKLVEYSRCSPTPFWTAGGIIGTLKDLKIWIKAIITGELLSPAMHAEQLKFSAPNTEFYGLGVMNGSGVMVGHSGEVPGYNSSMYYIPSFDAIGITLINRYPSEIEGAADQVNIALIQTMVASSVASFSYPDPADFSGLSWVDAFKAANEKLSKEYAFGEWKAVDWQGLLAKFLPRIAQAQAAGDEKAYYLALHEYLFSIPDGHLSLSAKDPSVPLALGKELNGGGFGMALAELDDGRVVVAGIVPGSQAAEAGIVAGTEILSWGGLHVKTAIVRVDVGALPYKMLTKAAGGENPWATEENHRLEQCKLLTRGPVGEKIEVEYKNPDATGASTITLAAVGDGGATFSLIDFAARPEFSDKIDYRILPEGFGYILVRMEYDFSNPGYPVGIYERFKDIIAQFIEAKVPGIILDFRGNYGGSDQLAADMCGFFYSTPAFYERQEYYDKRDGRFIRLTVAEKGPTPIIDKVAIEPQSPHFDGPIVVLVNPGTKSSGEGVPANLSKLPQCKVIGFSGTNGSFGMVGGEIALPGGYSIGYPFGRSVDAAGQVQLDSRNGVGGVASGLRVPKTLENVLALAAGTDVELQYAIKYLSGL